MPVSCPRYPKTPDCTHTDPRRPYNKNCPVTEGLDPERLQGEEGQKILRNTYRCMAGIYVGRTESGKMCYTFFDRDGKVSYINDNTAVYPFRPGFVLRRLTDKDPQ